VPANRLDPRAGIDTRLANLVDLGFGQRLALFLLCKQRDSPEQAGQNRGTTAHPSHELEIPPTAPIETQAIEAGKV